MLVKSTSRNHKIDFFRGIALILVFLTHFFQDSSLRYYFDYGRFGVQIFFFLSSYIIYQIIIDKKRYQNWYNFMKRRLFRIMIPIIIVAPLYYYNLQFQQFDYGRCLNEISFIFSFFDDVHLTKIPGLWSISSELFFYSLAPALIHFRLYDKRLHFFKIALMFFVWQVTINLLIDRYNLIIGAGLFERYGVFTSIIFFSMSLSVITGEPRKGFLSFLGIIIFILYGVGISPEMLQYNTLLLVLPIILGKIVLSHKVQMFRIRVINYIGKYSYELYLSHFIVISNANDFTLISTWPTLSRLLMCFALSLFLAVLISQISKFVSVFCGCLVRYLNKSFL
jgi:peptidoglycan/LPS O-acetylase OafA/YrhL